MGLAGDIFSKLKYMHTHYEKTILLVYATVDLGDDLRCSNNGTSLREILII